MKFGDKLYYENELTPKDIHLFKNAAFLHDIGKPHSYQDDEVRRFIGHPRKSSKIAYDILKRLEEKRKI